MPSGRQTFFRVLTILIAGMVVLFGFYNTVSPLVYRKTDPGEPIGYIYQPVKFANVGRGHLVHALIWSNREALIVKADLYYRIAGEPGFHGTLMERIGGSSYYAAELPPRPRGETYEYYITAVDSAGASVSIPENAPGETVMKVRWRSSVNLWLVLIQLGLLFGSGVFLLHTLYYAFLITFGNMGDLAQLATSARAHTALRWGWLALLIGGIPLSLYVSGASFGWDESWRPWPFGADVHDTRTLYLLIYFGIVLLVRRDLFRFTPTAPHRPPVSNKLFGWLILIGALLTLLAYAVPFKYLYR